VSTVLVLSQRDVVRLLDMEGCIEAMERALAGLARGEVHMPQRPVVRPPDETTLLGLMPVYSRGPRPVYALKAVCVAPDNAARGLDPHQGTVTLFDGLTGHVRAVMNASPITAIRTAACSAVATKLLAREDARELAVIGAGHQARAHVAAMLSVRSFDRIRIVSRELEHASALADETQGAEAVDSGEEAVRDADVVVTVTSSSEPVLRREWLKEGVHINAVGACVPSARELDTATVVDSSFFVDLREAAENEAGDYLAPLREGAIGSDHIRAEIGQVLTGAKPGRTSPDEITVFESLGLAVEDLAAAEYVVRRAEKEGIGTPVEF
jgi:ornithine cyclodeaminase/alanine dehydrogenase-like protein (mu-crystallin family)